MKAEIVALPRAWLSVVAAVVCIIAGALLPVRAETVYWGPDPDTGDYNGDFSDGVHWSTGGPPGGADRTWFTPGPPYTVTSAGGQSGLMARVMGETTLAFGGAIYSLGNDAGTALEVSGYGQDPAKLTLQNTDIEADGLECVGKFGAGILVIDANSTVVNADGAAHSGVLGQSSNADGQATVLGAWLGLGALTVGEAGHGALTAEAGGQVTTERLTIGDESTATGQATVDGLDTVLSVGEWLVVAASARAQPGGGPGGHLLLRSGARASGSQMRVGSGVGSSGLVELEGGGPTELSVANWLVVGHQGTGEMRIETGAKASAKNVAVGYGPCVEGLVDVTGPGNLHLSVHDELVVGWHGIGGMRIAGGGNVVVGGEAWGNVIVGREDSARGTLTVTGNGTTLTVASPQGGGELRIGGRSTVYVADEAVVTTGDLRVARDGDSGALEITGGAAVRAEGGSAGSPGARAFVEVAGEGSLLECTESFFLGSYVRDKASSYSSFNISGGGQVVLHGDALLGYGGETFVEIEGADGGGTGSALRLVTPGTKLTIGSYSSSQPSVFVGNGGRIVAPTTDLSGAWLHASDPPGGGLPAIQGDVKASRYATIGVGFGPGPAELTIDGKLDCYKAMLFMDIGGTAAGTEHDRLVVLGTQPSLTLSGTLFARLLDGFRPAPGDTFEMIHAPNIASIDTDDLHICQPAGCTFDTYYAFRSLFLVPVQTCDILPDNPPVNWDLPDCWSGGALPGAGDWAKLGDAPADGSPIHGPSTDQAVRGLVIGRDPDDPDPSDVDLKLGQGKIDAEAGTTMQDRSRLSGNGALGGDVLNRGGSVNPGDSPGRIQIEGDYCQFAGATYEAEIGGPNPVTQYDVLVVSGTAVLAEGSFVNVSLIDLADPVNNTNPYEPQVGELFDILVAGAVADWGATFTLPALSGGLVFEVEIIDVPQGQALRLAALVEAPAPGDANRDGFVNVFDLAILGNYYGVPGDMDWKHADFNDDDTVDVFDLALLGNNYQPGGGSPIPEPTALALLALGVVALARRGRRTSL